MFKQTLALVGLTLSMPMQAELVNADWQSAGDSLITLDTVNKLEWLDLTYTSGRSYGEISSKFDAGDEFEGWRYATENEIVGLFDSVGGDSDYYYSYWNQENNGLFDVLAPYWGDLQAEELPSVEIGEGGSRFFYDGLFTNGTLVSTGELYDGESSGGAHSDFVQINSSSQDHNFASWQMGSALVRSSVVPVPAAAWLFGSALIGLAGIKRKK